MSKASQVPWSKFRAGHAASCGASEILAFGKVVKNLERSIDNKDGDDFKLDVQRAQSKSERQAQFRQKRQEESSSSGWVQGVNSYVKNLDEEADDDALQLLFQPFGTITSVAAMKDEKGRCKGFGFVCFASPDEATKAQQRPPQPAPAAPMQQMPGGAPCWQSHGRCAYCRGTRRAEKSRLYLRCLKTQDKES
mmetsp:Transcript_79672/g.145666  ORF Transcript_79672/g.145666 Transcript_79672/m.145666 type:complete len:193 (-) Transcript_79672:55-633(-)